MVVVTIDGKKCAFAVLNQHPCTCVMTTISKLMLTWEMHTRGCHKILLPCMRAGMVDALFLFVRTADNRFLLETVNDSTFSKGLRKIWSSFWDLNAKGTPSSLFYLLFFLFRIPYSVFRIPRFTNSQLY